MVICSKKNANFTEEEINDAIATPSLGENQGDRWTFVAVLPETSFIQTVHHGKRTLAEATTFIEEIKSKRLIRKTLCHSKKAVFHDAHADLPTQVMNYTRTNDALKV